MKHTINIFPWIRMGVGGLFVLSGSQKLLGPQANFLFVVESYQFLTPLLASLTAWVVPWVELFLGVFVLGGLWLKGTLRGLSVLTALFILVVGQALLRKLPIQECGCFGELISLTPQTMIIFDICLLFLQILLLWNLKWASAFSLDRSLGSS